MKILNWPLGSGKTTQLVRHLAANPNTVYLAPTHAMKKFAQQLARREGLDIDSNRFLSVRDVRDGEFRWMNVTVLVDELEFVLELLTGIRPAMATLTSEDVEWVTPPTQTSIL